MEAQSRNDASTVRLVEALSSVFSEQKAVQLSDSNNGTSLF